MQLVFQNILYFILIPIFTTDVSVSLIQADRVRVSQILWSWKKVYFNNLFSGRCFFPLLMTFHKSVLIFTFNVIPMTLWLSIIPHKFTVYYRFISLLYIWFLYFERMGVLTQSSLYRPITLQANYTDTTNAWLCKCCISLLKTSEPNLFPVSVGFIFFTSQKPVILTGVCGIFRSTVPVLHYLYLYFNSIIYK